MLMLVRSISWLVSCCKITRPSLKGYVESLSMQIASSLYRMDLRNSSCFFMSNLTRSSYFGKLMFGAQIWVSHISNIVFSGNCFRLLSSYIFVLDWPVLGPFGGSGVSFFNWMRVVKLDWIVFARVTILW